MRGLIKHPQNVQVDRARHQVGQDSTYQFREALMFAKVLRIRRANTTGR